MGPRPRGAYTLWGEVHVEENVSEHKKIYEREKKENEFS